MFSVSFDHPTKSLLNSLHPSSIGSLLSHSIEHRVISTLSSGITLVFGTSNKLTLLAYLGSKSPDSNLISFHMSFEYYIVIKDNCSK